MDKTVIIALTKILKNQTELLEAINLLIEIKKTEMEANEHKK